MAALVLALGSTLVLPPRPWLVWNASASASIGLYAVTSPDAAVRGDMVIAKVPEPWRQLAASRRYIPSNVPLVKRIAAAQGDRVCGFGNKVTINGKLVARRLVVDARGRALPRWQGCIIMEDRTVLLLMPARDSFDGRYFGPTDRRDIIGRARLLWPR